MRIKLLTKLLIISSVSLFLSFQIQGQTYNEAVDAYNKGIGLIDTDIKAAIESLERSLEIASKLGTEGEELKEQAEIQIPGLYYDMAMGFYREKKVPEAAAGFKKAIEVSVLYEDNATKQRSENVLHQIYAIQANAAFRENENEEAIRLFDMALAINPQHARSHLGKGLVYRRLEDAENFKSSMDLAIESGIITKEEQIVSTAQSTARDFFLVRAVRAKGEENYNLAVEMVNSSLEFDSSFPETHYLLATIYNELSRFQDSIQSAGKALELLNGNSDETAKIYFEIGKSYERLGDSSGACAAYKDAAVGSYEAAAKYQMEHVLKCQ